MTLHEDVARIKAGDTAVIEFRHGEDQCTIGGPVVADHSGTTLRIGPALLAYVNGGPAHPAANLLRVIAHELAPAPLYANRPDITQPRPYDVVAAENYPGGEVIPLTYWNNLWRSHGGTMYTTDRLLEVGPLTLLATAQP